MSSQPLFHDDESELIPQRDRRQHSFSKPIEIRAMWLVLIGAGLLAWQISLTGWHGLLTETGQLVWWGALAPVAYLWWKLRRSGLKTPWSQTVRETPSRGDDESPLSEVRLVEDVDAEPDSWKLIMAMVSYLAAVLTLVVVALWRMLS